MCELSTFGNQNIHGWERFRIFLHQRDYLNTLSFPELIMQCCNIHIVPNGVGVNTKRCGVRLLAGSAKVAWIDSLSNSSHSMLNLLIHTQNTSSHSQKLCTSLCILYSNEQLHVKQHPTLTSQGAYTLCYGYGLLFVIVTLHGCQV